MNKVEAFFAAIPAWIEAHPVLMTLIVIPLLGALWNFVTKPRTEEEYEAIAKESPRFASFLRLMRKLFPDPRGAFDAFTSILAKKGKPLAILLALGLAVSSIACTPAKSPIDARTEYRMKLTMIGRGVNAAANLCLETAKAICDADDEGLCQDEASTEKARALAKACAGPYNAARAVLLAADDALDAKTALDEGQTACAAKAGLDAAEKMLGALKPFGVDVPPEIEDGIAIARVLAGKCVAP